MKTNLYKNALPRGSCVFLKMVVTVTALLCCQLIVYGQPVQTSPADGVNLTTIPLTLDWTTSSTASTDIQIYTCSSIENGTPTTNIDLGGYSKITEKRLKYDSNGDGNEDTDIVDLSGVTYSPVTGTLFMITNKGPASIYEFNVDGSYIRTINLTNWNDPEDIVHLYEDKFAIIEEKDGEVLEITIIDSNNNATINLNSATVTSLPNPDFTPYVDAQGGIDGIEGVSYNPATETVYCVTEIPMQLHSFNINDTSPNSTLSTTCDLSSIITNDQQAPNLFGITDLSAVHHLELTKGLEYLDVDNHLLILSDESNVLIEIDENCNEYSRLQLPPSAFGIDTQLEGVTMDDCGNIYVVGEPNHFFVYSNQNLDLNPPGILEYQASTFNNPYTVLTGVFEPDTEYCWRVKNSDECVWSPFWSFTTPETICTTTQSFSTNSRISSNNDDVEQRQIENGGTVYTTSSDLELVYDSGTTGNQYVGLLFRNLNIPPNAIITNAYIQFTVDDQRTGTGGASLNIAAHSADNIASFSTANYGISDLTLTTASVNWTPTEWTSLGVAGPNQQTPDISSVVQEVVNISGWSANSNLAIIITGTGTRAAESHNESPSEAPIIHVDYTVATIAADSDNDGVCDDEDVCPGFDDNLIGEPCDDNDVCTTGEIYDANCNCTGGTLVDLDNDGVCDINDACPGEDDGIIGTNCDDNDPCTTGDVYDSTCNCVGTFQDMDGDGVCDEDDICLGDDNVDTDGDGVPDACDDCDNGLVGMTCEDGDLCTIGETYDANCNCTGGIVQDTDNDGICDEEDPCYDDPANDCDITYCEAQGNTAIAYIQSVALNSGFYESGDNGNSNGYFDHFDYTGTLLARVRNTNTITLTPNYNSVVGYTQNWGIWIDFNKDGDFDDTDEQVYVDTSPDSATPVMGTFNAPSGVGTTTMRVVMRWNNVIPTPCDQSDYGEVEDYKILLSTDCEENLTIYDFDVPGSYDAFNFTQTDNTSGTSITVDTGEHLELSGGNRVRLNNGFSVTSGASLRADNEDCSQQ